jgi:hypothetical protein
MRPAHLFITGHTLVREIASPSGHGLRSFVYGSELSVDEARRFGTGDRGTGNGLGSPSVSVRILLRFCAKHQPSRLHKSEQSIGGVTSGFIVLQFLQFLQFLLFLLFLLSSTSDFGNAQNSTWLDQTQTGIVILNFPSSLLESSGAVGADAHPQESARSTASSQRACRRSPLHCRPVASLLTTALRCRPVASLLTTALLCRPVVVVAAEQQGPAPCEQ